MMTTHPFNALAIGQYTQALNNRLNCYFDGINAIQKVKSFFLVGNNSSFQPKKPISVKTSVKVRTKYAVKTVFLMRTNHCMGLNLKCWFCQSIKRKTRKQIPPKSSIKRMHYFLFCLLSFSRQAAITQAEKLVFSFWDCSSIFSISSCGKRIPLVKDLLFLYPVAISKKILINLVFKHYTLKNCLEKALTCLCTLFYSVYAPSKFCGVKKQSPEVLPTLSRDLTKPLNEVMIMANRYDSAHLRAEQSKLYKFYDLSTAQVIQTTATTERQARKILGRRSLIFIARIRITPIIEQARTWGGCYHE
ncbi:host cell division inhibitor Icd-like protein [Gilliamella apicola]|jgi:hypothetical protein|uniref:host cell division inhibitor Icd-like protein n=1 Tax=Gilliamella apicola TaxID=1196095 RepID=UPI00209C2406|nr:host cell division inhibitor Icd-like protein [Gilliamella apicola]